MLSMTHTQSETLKYLFLLFSDGDTIPLSGKLKQEIFFCVWLADMTMLNRVSRFFFQNTFSIQR
jgi:hypothetical protein